MMFIEWLMHLMEMIVVIRLGLEIWQWQIRTRAMKIAAGLEPGSKIEIVRSNGETWRLRVPGAPEDGDQ